MILPSVDERPGLSREADKEIIEEPLIGADCKESAHRLIVVDILRELPLPLEGIHIFLRRVEAHHCRTRSPQKYSRLPRNSVP